MQTQMFQTMVNEQTRQLGIAPHISSAPPIPCLGHPPARPDVPAEGSRPHHCEAARARMWASKRRRPVAIKRPALVSASSFFLFLSVKLEKRHHSGDKASPPVTPTSRGFKPCLYQLATSVTSRRSPSSPPPASSSPAPRMPDEE